MRAPLRTPLKRSVFLPATAFAPSARKPAKCVSSRLWPIASPPGGGRDARPARASRGPAKRKLVLIRAAVSGGSFTDLRRGVEIFTLFAARSRETLAPKPSAARSMVSTSRMSGTFVSVTGSGVSSDAAIMGRTAFLFPETS